MSDNSSVGSNQEDDLLFPEDLAEKTDEIRKRPPWKIIIADDQEEIHSVTKLVLDDFTFQERSLQFLSAYSGEETKQLILKHPDVAFILLDVVMETDDAGLQVIHFIREELKNSIVQIVLNTGQPGQAPEHEVITKYDINDYKSKTEFNARKLLTSITASLRAYNLSRNLQQVNQQLNQYRNHLEDLVKERTAALESANGKLKLEIDERKRAEKALHLSYEIQKNILSASPIGICLVKEGKIEWVNDEMMSLFGFTADTDYRQLDTRLFFSTEAEFDRVDQIFRNHILENKPLEVDAVLQRKGGSTFPGNLRLSCKDPEDYNRQAILTITDNTWRMQAEQDRIQKERLQGALEMSGSICHELNQPLQYVSGSAEILLMDLAENDPFFPTISKMKAQIDRMGDITKKLMGITSYRTRDYVGGRKIIDIDKASEGYRNNPNPQ
ncbi:MAG: PAS domain-containing protein [Thermodesulfobacteriota bacterium]